MSILAHGTFTQTGNDLCELFVDTQAALDFAANYGATISTIMDAGDIPATSTPNYCADCDGTGKVNDPDTADASLEGDPAEYRVTYQEMNCPACCGTGELAQVLTPRADRVTISPADATDRAMRSKLPTAVGVISDHGANLASHLASAWRWSEYFAFMAVDGKPTAVATVVDITEYDNAARPTEVLVRRQCQCGNEEESSWTLFETKRNGELVRAVSCNECQLTYRVHEGIPVEIRAMRSAVRGRS